MERAGEPQDIGKVIFNRSHKRTDANIVRAGAVIREAYLSKYAGGSEGAEQTSIHFDQAMKTRPKEAQEAL